MLDILARLLISAIILIGTAYDATLPAATVFEHAGSSDGVERSAQACPPRPETALRFCLA